MSQKKIIYSTYRPLGMLYLICETPFYPGAERGVAQIDLPVQRNPITSIPHGRSTTIKGAIRNAIENANIGNSKMIFGDADRTGAIDIGNAEILLFPVRGNVELFWYTTSPHQLNMWIKSLSVLGKDVSSLEKSLEAIKSSLNKKKNIGLVSDDCPYVGNKIILLDDVIISLEGLGDLSTIIEEIKEAIPKIPGYSYIKEKIRRNLVVVDDNTLQMLTNRGLYRVARIRLKPETKTVEAGALFFQELIPENTILFARILEAQRYQNDANVKNAVDDFKKWLQRNPLVFIAGDETTGKGQIRLSLVT